MRLRSRNLEGGHHVAADGIRRELELESLQAYPHVLRNLEERKLRIKAKSS